jgi:hypothetical protein
MLSTRKMTAVKGPKLSDPFIGPFRVVAVHGDVNVEVELPPSMNRTHPVFHVDKLKRFVRSQIEWPGREQLDRPPPMMMDGEEYFEVEKIIGKKEVEEEAPVEETEDSGGDGGLRRSARLRGRGPHRQRPKRRRVVQYLVKWKGWDEADATWKAEDELDQAREAVEDYEHQQRVERGEESVALMVITM